MTDPGAVARLVEQWRKITGFAVAPHLRNGAVLAFQMCADELEAALAADRGAGPELERRVIDALLYERREDLGKEACDRCVECGAVAMCAFHSVLSVLSGDVAIQGRDGKWLKLSPCDEQGGEA